MCPIVDNDGMENKSMLETVVAALNAAKGGWREIAEASGVPYSTLCKIAQRATENPGVAHVQALHDYFCAVKAAA